MIKKLISNLVLILLIFISSFFIILSTIGIETDKFNQLISKKIGQTKNIELELKKIKFKLDVKELRLFLETLQPKIKYNSFSIPTLNVKVYVDFLSLVKANLKIKKINVNLDKLDIVELNELSEFVKPSNFKNFLTNKIKEGNLISEIEIFFNDSGKINNYIIKGNVDNVKANLLDELNLSKTKFNFFADQDDIIIKNISGNLENIEIKNGDIKLNLEKGLKLDSNFNSVINLNDKTLRTYSKFIDKFELSKQLRSLDGNFNNTISLELDNTYKLKNLNYKLFGKLQNSKFNLLKSPKYNFIPKELREIYFSDTQVILNYSPKKFEFKSEGNYSFNNKDYLKFKTDNIFDNKFLKSNTDLDFKESFFLEPINYEKNTTTVANLSIKLEKKKNTINVKELNYVENKNSINITGLELVEGNFSSLKKMNINTSKNNFFVQWGKKILIKGNKFDASNIPKFLSKSDGKNIFNKINKNIEIDFKNIKAPLSEKLQNFRLIGEIQNGKFIKISSKGDFGGDNFLDISMKKDKKTNKRFLEVYSDLSRPLLSEYEFFKGLTGGKLFFTSLIDGTKSNSKLKIENFKVINAPGLIKLLSLADLGGLVDLAEGEGLSFDLLEISMEKNENIFKFNEILALGPSMSVLMEGYQDSKGVTSLRGTLVPAKTLNTIISKIPVIGSIVIPKEVGEGLFGVSFKIKGPKGNIKTSINPLRTLTPRFIQKIVDRNKFSN